MKIFFYILMIFILMINCGQMEQNKISVRIKGKITNPVSPIVSIEGPQFKEKTKLNSENEFKMILNINRPGFFKFINDENAPLYLSPGDDISMTLNAEQFDETLTFTGNGSEINNYLINKYLIFEALLYNKEKEIFSLNKTEYISNINKLFSRIEAVFQKLEKTKKNINKNFLEIEKKILLYQKVKYYLIYPKEHKKSTNNQAINLDKTYYSILNKIDINDPSQIDIEAYRDILKLILDKKTEDKIKKNNPLDIYSIEYARNKINTALSEFSNKIIKDYLIYNSGWQLIQKGTIDQQLYKKIVDNITKKKWKENISKMYKKMKPLLQGSIAPVFSCIDIKGKTFTLKDFRGKYVYIDVWSTKCNPCIKEIPYLEKLAENNKNILVVSISIDNSKDDWKKMVLDKKLKGIQLYAKNGWKSKFAKDYVIYATPTYILIDKEGRIKNIRAPGPREGILNLIKD